MDKKRAAQFPLRAKRIAGLQSKLRSGVKTMHKVKHFASLEHMLNAAALYQMGKYERASLAFQRAMAESDAPEMLETLESQLPDKEPAVCKEKAENEDYLDRVEEIDTDDLVGDDDLEFAVEDELDLSVEDEDEEAGSDVLDGSEDDFSVDDEDSVSARAAKNLAAISS